MKIRPIYLWCAAIAVPALCAAYLRTYQVSAWLADLGTYLDCAYRISLGQTPYKDFFIVTAPLTYGILGACLKIFGQSYFVWRIYVALQCAALCVATFLFCERALKLTRVQCACLALLQFIWSPQMMIGTAWYDNDSTFFTLMAGLFFFQAWSRDRTLARWSFLSGVFCALAFWSKQDSGAGAIAGGLLSATALTLGGDASARRRWLCFASGIAAVLSVGILYFWAHGALAEMIEWIVLRALKFKWDPLAGMPNPGLFSPFTTRIDRSSKFIVALYCLAALAAWQRFRISRDRREAALCGAALLWTVSLYAGLMTHGGQGYTNKVSTLAATFGILWRPWPSGAPNVLRGKFAAGILALGLGILGLYGIRYQRNFTASPTSVPLRSRRIAGLMTADNKPLDALVDYIDKYVPADDDFINFDQIIVYFATQRNMPHPVTDPNAMRDEDEDRILRNLRNQPRIRWYFHLGKLEDFSRGFVMGNGKVRFRRLEAYVQERFRRLESRNGFTVWILKSSPSDPSRRRRP